MIYNEVMIVKKRKLTYQEEMVNLRERMDNLESKISLTAEPLLIDAMAYELLALQSRMNFLIATARQQGN